MAKPPTARELRNARIFGFISVFIGLALALAIFWSVLAPWLAEREADPQVLRALLP